MKENSSVILIRGKKHLQEEFFKRGWIAEEKNTFVFWKDMTIEDKKYRIGFKNVLRRNSLLSYTRVNEESEWCCIGEMLYSDIAIVDGQISSLRK